MTRFFVILGTILAGILTIFGIRSKKAEAKQFKELSDKEIDSNNKQIEEIEQQKETVVKKKKTAKKTVAVKKQKVAELEEKKKAPVKRNAPAKKNLKSDIVSKTRRKTKTL